jgi:hypothetical protein
MSAIEACRTAEMGGHVARCDNCDHLAVSYNSCRNRHCPKRQGAAAQAWLADRQADLLPVAYYHVVFTLPGEVAAIAFQNKAVVYDLLFKAAAETLTTIAADPKHLGARIGLTAVLHTWGSAMTHHPHVHCIVPGGGVSLDGQRWVACRPGFFLPVRVLSRLFRRLFLDRLEAAHAKGQLAVFGELAPLAQPSAFRAHLPPLRRAEWVVYAKRPFGGPAAVLAYLARYTHRVAIANSRLIAMDQRGVSFRWKDYRTENPTTGAVRIKTMTLSPDEFLRRFLLHVLPSGFHRIRHYGLLAHGPQVIGLDRVRALIGAQAIGEPDGPVNDNDPPSTTVRRTAPTASRRAGWPDRRRRPQRATDPAPSVWGPSAQRLAETPITAIAITVARPADRGFLPCRPSDAGPNPAQASAPGRHPKP